MVSLKQWSSRLWSASSLATSSGCCNTFNHMLPIDLSVVSPPPERRRETNVLRAGSGTPSRMSREVRSSPRLRRRTSRNGVMYSSYSALALSAVARVSSAHPSPIMNCLYQRWNRRKSSIGRPSIVMITRMGSWLVNSWVRLTCPRSANVSTSERATSRTMGVNASSFFPTRASLTRLRCAACSAPPRLSIVGPSTPSVS